jgi:hypothetical protein
LYSEKNFSLTVNAGPVAPTISITSPLPAGTTDTAYNQTLTASGGTAPYSWALASGSLPSGLVLNSSSGLISGTPTSAGTANFRVRVIGVDNLYSEKDLSLTISGCSTRALITAGMC